MRQRQGKRQFKIRWKGYGPGSDTWENEEDLSCPNIIKSFLEKNRIEISNESKAEKWAGRGANNRTPKKTKIERGKGNKGAKRENDDKEYEVSIYSQVKFVGESIQNFIAGSQIPTCSTMTLSCY
jgi:hypothetical protein